MADFQQSRGLYGEPFMQKYFGDLGMHMVLCYVGKRRGMEIGDGSQVGILAFLALGHSMGCRVRNSMLSGRLGIITQKTNKQ
jgi:hypothetical protein